MHDILRSATQRSYSAATSILFSPDWKTTADLSPAGLMGFEFKGGFRPISVMRCAVALPANGDRPLLAILKDRSAALFSFRRRSWKKYPLGAHFRCCANCRHYVPPHTIPMLDGPPASYCSHPERIGPRYISEHADVLKMGLFRKPGDGCDDLFEANVRDG